MFQNSNLDEFVMELKIKDKLLISKDKEYVLTLKNRSFRTLGCLRIFCLFIVSEIIHIKKQKNGINNNKDIEMLNCVYFNSLNELINNYFKA